MKKRKNEKETLCSVGELVIQHNKLIEARYNLSLQEKRIILWLSSQMKSDDEDFKDYKLPVRDFAKMANITNKKLYEEIMEITEKLMKRVMKIRDVKTNRTIQVSWLSSAEYIHNEGCVLLCFDPKLKLYLLNLKQEFTKISLSDLFELKSIYSVRIFELLVQYESIGKRIITLFDLRSYCGINEKEYSDYFDLKRFSIERAKTEINNKTEYEIDYKEIKEARKVIALEWTIKKKTHFEKSQIEKAIIIQKELRSEKAIIQQLLEYGFTDSQSKKIVKLNNQEIVANAIKAVDIQVSKGKVKNAKAMLAKAIQEKWHPEKYQNRTLKIAC